MEPLFFGEADAQLYGVYHAPGTAAGPGGAVLLCPPAGQEYMRMHRAYRWLADLLARRGYHVLRFDYPGLGDSYGAMADMTLAHWVAATRQAGAELNALSGLRKHSVIATRLGTLVAAQAMTGAGNGQLVLWEPRPAPGDFLDEMLAIAERGTEPRANFVAANGDLHFNGFCYSRAFQSSLRSADFLQLDFSGFSRILLLSNQAEPKLQQLRQGIGQSNPAIDYLAYDGLKDWNRVDRIGGLFLPQDTLREIDKWLA